MHYKMNSVAPLSTADLEAYSKCAQLYAIINGDSANSAKQAKRIIRKKGDINFQIPSSCYENFYIGHTLLHIAWNNYNCEITEDLLNLGANFTIKNGGGHTVLHCAFRLASPLYENLPKYEDDYLIKLILSAHVKFGNSTNPSDNNGTSHFHIACMANNTKAVEFFLDNGIDVNQTVDKKATRYSGFTPLHCAVKCYSTETVEVLLRYAADGCIKNGYGMTPLHQLLHQRIELLQIIRRTRTETLSFEEELEKIERAIFTLLGNNYLDKVYVVDSTGLSSFHLACTMQDTCKIESLLEQVEDIDHWVKGDSPMWPGYTALHFAAYCNIDAMKLLHGRGANIDVKNAEGLTPIDICIRSGHIESITSAISLRPEWANIHFSDNKTRLVDFISAMRDMTQLRNFLRNSMDDINMTLPNNSPLWQGCTPLHLAVIIANIYKLSDNCALLEENLTLQQIEELLISGADVTWKDASNRTPLHYAFRLQKNAICQILRNHHHSSANPVDGTNLSHLHIACMENDKNLVEKILSNNKVDVNITYRGEEPMQEIKPGLTPVDCVKDSKLKQMLVERGATGLPSKDRYGTNSLHSACGKGDKEAVQRLLELGADVDLALDDGRTPLHLAVTGNSPEVVELLLQRGADLVAKDVDGETPLYWVFRERLHFLSSTKDLKVNRQVVVSVLKQQEEFQRRMQKETGITMLHVACHMLDVEDVRSQLDGGVNVNARVNGDSKLWPGCTPLHVLMLKVKGRLYEEELSSEVGIIVDLLLEKGADVTLADYDEDTPDTPIHMSYDSQDKDSLSRTKVLLKHQRDFRVNPVNYFGLSHFHLAVLLSNVEAVEKFLEHAVDVNQPPDYLAEAYGGLTPLHMAVENANTVSGMRIVDLLLSHGADVNLEDASGESALHRALQIGSSRLGLMENLMSFGANINCENIHGVTPFESSLCSGDVSVEDIRFFFKHGCLVNVSNPISDRGYLATVLKKNDKAYRNLLFEELMKAPDVVTFNELGRSLIHNVVAVTEPAIACDDYVDLFKRFAKFGYDVDDQDHAGQTALHLAAQFGNNEAISALLNMGADTNIVDSKGNSPLSYAVEPCVKCGDDFDEHHHEQAVEVLVLQILKMHQSYVNISEINWGHMDKGYKILNQTNNRDYDDDDRLSTTDFYSEITKLSNFKIKPVDAHLTLEDFLSEKKAVIWYSRMSESDRRVIDRAFDTVDVYFEELLSVFKLQHRKAVTKFQLLQAASSWNLSMGYRLPDLCIKNILRFLTHGDLKRLVAAMNLVNEN